MLDSYHLTIQSHREILNAIRIHREISGAELSRLTKYQPSTIVYILRALEKRGLIEISRISFAQGSAGKPPTLWRLVPNKGYIFGFELIPNELRSIIINFSGDVIEQEHKTGIEDLSSERIPCIVNEFCSELIDANKIPREKIIGAGVALPGLVDRLNGLVLYSRKLFLQNCPLREMISKKLSLPVEIVNDANAGALGIKWFLDSPEPAPPHIVFLTLNEKQGQMGAGLILNGALYEGAAGSAGEIFKSLPALPELVEAGRQESSDDQPLYRAMQSHRSLSLEKVILYAKEKCKISEYILGVYSNFIVDEICRISELINPGWIILGGDITAAKELILNSIRTDVDVKLHQLYPMGVSIPRIMFSKLGIYSVSSGAAALILRKIFE